MRRTLCWLLIFSLFIVVSGCGIMDWIFPEKDGDGPPDEDEYIELPGPDEEDTSSQGRIIYVADLHGKYVLPITCDIPWEEGIAKAVVRHMVEGGPAQQFLTTHGLKAVLPAGTTILGMSIRDGACIVDFSPELLHTADQVHERLLLDALTYTLTEFPTIETVSIRVSGEPLTRMPHGTLVDAVLSRERGVNSLASAKGTGAAVTIYLRMDSLAGGSLLVPVTRPVASTLDAGPAALEPGGRSRAGVRPQSVLPTTTRIEGLSVQAAWPRGFQFRPGPGRGSERGGGGNRPDPDGIVRHRQRQTDHRRRGRQAARWTGLVGAGAAPDFHQSPVF